ncbi:YbaB/EbfC family nucleoid-associated protein [Natronogracilivirga saccharolytica]|uniref:Nucleoid-associated protein NATSA_02385 n=1 Tax=Natronogracilivirga saccharolytica TaxID=2812953 RepID=A0A8J7S3V2_9BACT|nr:YbaB/EbfC family nucleoid-associated protein [Natronogracilivirga saccharolytica]MBP3191503.1 YbaB/EbfC family nucleoid-associated protein [Natronogracilivirga saccharolytica]
MNMADMFGKLTDMQKKMEEAKQQLHELEVEAHAGGGMVKVTANGNREITSIKIDKDLVDPNDTEMLEDLVVAGINQALKKAEEAGQEKMSEITKGMLPGGMDLGNLGLK